MRKALLLLSILLATSIPVLSQFGDLYKAKEGWTAIKDSVGNMELIMVLASESVDSPFIINLDNGTSDGWLYMVRDKSDSTKNAVYAVSKDGDDWFYYILVENVETIGDLLTLENVKWMDSDAFITALEKNQIYNNYIKSNPNPISVDIALVYYPYDMGDDMPPQFYKKYIWMININEELDCVVNSLTGEVECEQTITIVNEMPAANDINIYPQPADDFINITLPADREILSLEFYNLFGSKVLDYSNNSRNNLITIPCQNLESGTYLIKINTQTGVITKKIVVIH